MRSSDPFRSDPSAGPRRGWEGTLNGTADGMEVPVARDIKASVVVITGASSGIGKAAALASSGTVTEANSKWATVDGRWREDRPPFKLGKLVPLVGVAAAAAAARRALR